MSRYRIALRYDKSLLSLAIEQGALEEVRRDMEMLDNLCKENRDFRLMLQSPVVSHQKKLAILKAIFGKKAHKLTIGLFEIISRRNREEILPDLAAVFREQYNEYKGIATASLVTTYPVEEEQRKEFKEYVKKTTQAKSVELKEEIDPGIIGGYVLKIGDRQIDNSLRTKLKELKLKFEV